MINFISSAKETEVIVSKSPKLQFTQRKYTFAAGSVHCIEKNPSLFESPPHIISFNITKSIPWAPLTCSVKVKNLTLIHTKLEQHWKKLCWNPSCSGVWIHLFGVGVFVSEISASAQLQWLKLNSQLLSLLWIINRPSSEQFQSKYFPLQIKSPLVSWQGALQVVPTNKNWLFLKFQLLNAMSIVNNKPFGCINTVGSRNLHYPETLKACN